MRGLEGQRGRNRYNYTIISRKKGKIKKKKGKKKERKKGRKGT